MILSQIKMSDQKTLLAQKTALFDETQILHREALGLVHHLKQPTTDDRPAQSSRTGARTNGRYPGSRNLI